MCYGHARLVVRRARAETLHDRGEGNGCGGHNGKGNGGAGLNIFAMATPGWWCDALCYYYDYDDYYY